MPGPKAPEKRSWRGTLTITLTITTKSDWRILRWRAQCEFGVESAFSLLCQEASCIGAGQMGSWSV